jgi:hypothetical protein
MYPEKAEIEQLVIIMGIDDEKFKQKLFIETDLNKFIAEFKKYREIFRSSNGY